MLGIRYLGVLAVGVNLVVGLGPASSFYLNLNHFVLVAQVRILVNKAGGSVAAFISRASLHF